VLGWRVRVPDGLTCKREEAHLVKSRRSRDRSKERGATPVAADAAPSTRIDVALPAWAQTVAAALGLALALSALLPEIAWQAQIFAAPDFQSPSDFATAGRAALDAGEYPLWNPYIFLGMPSFASLAFTPYVFPPSDLLRAVGALPGMPPLAWLLFYFWLAGFGVFVLMRALRGGFWPSLLAAVCFMATPHLVSWGVFGHGSKLASVALLPWLLWAALQVRHAARPLLWTAVLALVLGLQLLRGHPQIAFYGLLMLAIWGIVEIVGPIRDRSARRASLLFAARMCVAVALGAGLSAVLLLPVRAYAPESIRGATEGGGAAYDYATMWSHAPREVTSFVVPSAVGFGEGTYVGSMPFTNFPHYLGQAALLFGATALLVLRGRWMVFLAAVLLVSLFVSFGRHAPLLYNVLYDHLPYFNRFRVPLMILVLFQLGTSLLAGLGCAWLFGLQPRFVEWRRAPSARASRTLLLVVAVGAAVLLVATLPWADSVSSQVAASKRVPAAARDAYVNVARDMLRGDGLRVSLLAVGNALLVFLVWRRRLAADLAGALLVVLLLFDLGGVDRRMVRPEKTWPGVAPRVTARGATQTTTPLLDFLRTHGSAAPAPTRVFPTTQTLFESNRWMSHSISSVGGYHPAKLSRYQALVENGRGFDPGRRPALARSHIQDLLGVQYFVGSQPLSGLGDAAYSGADGVAYANDSVLPRAWLVGAWRLVEREGCVQALLDPGFQPRSEALVESHPSLEPPSTQPIGQATIRAFAANRVEIRVQSSTAALLVLSEAYHFNWRAQVNGQRSEVLAADCILRAVAVPSGPSSVVFEFVDPALRAGLGVSIGSFVVVVLLFLLGVRRRSPATRLPAVPEGGA
jgi:hypothetical protein